MNTTRLVTVVLGLCLGAAAIAQETAQDTGIPPQPLNKALEHFADKSGLQVIYVAELAEGRYTAGAEPNLSQTETLDQLLASTGLEYEFLNDRTVTVKAVAEEGGDRDSGNGRMAGTTQKFVMTQASETDQTKSTSSLSQLNTAVRREERNPGMEEIVVTAQKREESLQDVPLSISVLTAEDIDQRGLLSASDYLRGMPGVNQTEVGYGGQAVIIRGMETTTLLQNFQAGPTTATYFGETPTTQSAGLLGSNVDIKLVDIERVEVLRGPQGTAFGSSSLGGAVRVIPVAPKLDRIEGRVAVGYSATSGTGGNNYNVQTVGNFPLIEDRLAVRASGYWYKDSGFYRNRAASDPHFQSTIVAPYSVQAFATDRNQVGGTSFAGGRIAALFQASDALHFTLMYLKQKMETDGYPGANSGGYQQTYLGVAAEHAFRGQSEGINDNYIDIANAVMEYDFGWAALLATYSYLEGGTKHANSVGVFGLPWPVSATQSTPHRQHSGEIRLGTKFDGSWNFLAGAFAAEHDDKYTADWLWNGDPATNFFSPRQRDLVDFIQRRSLKQKAAFAEVSSEFLPGFTLTGGVRVYDYERTEQIDQSGPFAGGDDHRRTHTEATGSTFRTNLSYKPSDDTLLYASWAQGFRLGRPQSQVRATICDTDDDGVIDGTSVPIASTGHVESDAVDSYELGVKFTSRRLTIDGAVFRIDWSKLPVGVIAPCGVGYVTNAGGALSRGLEFQANLQLASSFRFYAGGSWISARLTEDVPTQGWSTGDRLPGSPKVNANLGLQYGFDIAGRAGFVRADAIYVGPFYMDVPQSPNLRAGDYVKLDASVRVRMGMFDIDLFVRNLTNEDESVSRDFSISHRLRPRTIGLRFSRGVDF